jgi:hypothetical protein
MGNSPNSLRKSYDHPESLSRSKIRSIISELGWFRISVIILIIAGLAVGLYFLIKHLNNKSEETSAPTMRPTSPPNKCIECMINLGLPQISGFTSAEDLNKLVNSEKCNQALNALCNVNGLSTPVFTETDGKCYTSCRPDGITGLGYDVACAQNANQQSMICKT